MWEACRFGSVTSGFAEDAVFAGAIFCFHALQCHFGCAGLGPCGASAPADLDGPDCGENPGDQVALKVRGLLGQRWSSTLTLRNRLSSMESMGMASRNEIDSRLPGPVETMVVSLWEMFQFNKSVDAWMR